MKYGLPEEIRLQADKTALGLVYQGEVKVLPAEFLRVYSPSAEVRGHAVGQEVLQTGKMGITIVGLEPVGQYALKIVFSDGMTVVCMTGIICINWRMNTLQCGLIIYASWKAQVHRVFQTH